MDYKFKTKFEMLDGGNGTSEPGILETWELYGCFIQNVNYNQLAYNTSEPVTISMTLRFDNALQKPDGDGVGTQVTRTVGVNSTG
jgi:hypothetical protein